MQEQRINKYNKYVVAEDFLLVSNYNSVMELPIFLRAVINTTSKDYLTEKRQSVNALAACFLLSGQRSIPTRARKSIAGFKLREGALLGCRTTLRKKKLYTIIDKLLIFALPRLYSEKDKYMVLDMASLLKRNSKYTTTNKSISSSGKKGSFLEQKRTQGTKVLSSEEKSQLSVHLRLLRKGDNKNIAKNEEMCLKGRIYHLALGIKDLLLMPELQEFSPLFDSVRGINLSVSLSNPRIKGTNLAATFLLSKQRKKDLKAPTNSCSAKLSTELEYELCSAKFDLPCTPHILSKDINGVRECRLSLLALAKQEKQKQKIDKEHTLNAFCELTDTYPSRDNRKRLFLTCFQYPRQYN